MFRQPPFDFDAYTDWLRQRADAMGHEKRSRFITLSREYGCEGFPTAQALCALMNGRGDGSRWFLFSHLTLESLIADERLDVELIDRLSEQRYSFANWFIDGMVPEYLKSPQSITFTRLRKLILNLVEKGNCIILGGGAQILTHHLDSSRFCALHQRIVGAFPFRVQRVQEAFNLSEKDAVRQVRKKESARNDFVSDFTGRSSQDMSLYHLIFNNERNDAGLMAATTYDYLLRRGFFDEEQ